MEYLKNRLKEASTYAGIGVFATLGASLFPAHAFELHSVAGACAALATLMKEGA